MQDDNNMDHISLRGRYPANSTPAPRPPEDQGGAIGRSELPWPKNIR